MCMDTVVGRPPACLRACVPACLRACVPCVPDIELRIPEIVLDSAKHIENATSLWVSAARVESKCIRVYYSYMHVIHVYDIAYLFWKEVTNIVYAGLFRNSVITSSDRHLFFHINGSLGTF
jgi:hypothetical protein